MKYLYGDSEPFPLQYDFLKTLELFMKAATRVVQLESEVSNAQREAQETAAAEARTLEALEGFHAGAAHALQEAALKSGQPVANEYVTALRDHGQRLVEERRRALQTAQEREATALTSRSRQGADEIKTSLETFFRTARLPVLGTEVSCRVVDPKSSELAATFTHPLGLVTSFTLPTDNGWQAMRRVSEFATEVEPKVGVKKKWLKQEVSAETERLDDYFLGGFVLSDHKALIRLRRKADQPDALVFKLARSKGSASGEVEHPGDPRADALPGHLDQHDAATLERLWNALLESTVEALNRRERMISLTVDSTDALANRLGVEVVTRLVTLFAPTVIELAKRSPNNHELTLKCETSAGKREELYLRKSELLKQLQPLPSGGRAIFEPLGLSQWVPPVTAPPPPLAPPTLRPAHDPTPADLGDLTQPGIKPGGLR